MARGRAGGRCAGRCVDVCMHASCIACLLNCGLHGVTGWHALCRQANDEGPTIFDKIISGDVR
eukprot:362856-Chlamydomonas_euryale.AAC.16